MPTYDYQCDACGHTFEQFQRISEDVLTKCPECNKKKLVRLFGTGAAVVFKGSGFYQTDYRSESYKKGAKSEKGANASKSDSSGSKSDKGSNSGGSDSGSKSTATKSSSTNSTAD